MRITKSVLIAIVVMFTVTEGIAQKNKKQRKKKEKTTALKLYDGPELQIGQQVRMMSETLGKKYAYFIAVNDEDIPNRSLMTGAQEILLLPGEHKIQMRFVAKGEIAIPIEPFEPFFFEAGKNYMVKFEYTPGKGNYLTGAGSTRIRLWIEEEGKEGILTEKTVDGFGKSVK